MHDQPLPLWPLFPWYPLPLPLSQRPHLLKPHGLSTVEQADTAPLSSFYFTGLKTYVVGNVRCIDCEVNGVGDIDVTVCNRYGLHVTVTLKEVLYVQDLKERTKGYYLRLPRVRRAT